MLDFRHSFTETRHIKVLVAPIGENTLFDDHFQIVSKLKVAQLYDLNRPSGRKKSPIKSMNWNNGNLIFDYLRYDRAAYGPVDLDNFQSSNRILMIMGIINYPEVGTSLNKIDIEMDALQRRHQGVILRRVFIFNYPFDASPLPANIKEPNSVIMFPPDGQCEGGSMVDVHLREVMGEAATKIIVSLDNQAILFEDYRNRNLLPPSPELTSGYDDLPNAVASESSFFSGQRLKNIVSRKPSGRINKWLGDLCLQVCSPLDGVEYYFAAMNDCALCGDDMWYARSIEGLISSLFVAVQLGYALEDFLPKEMKGFFVIPEGESKSDFQRIIKYSEEKINEALIIYAKDIAFSGMESECCIRMARLFEQYGEPFEKNLRMMNYLYRGISTRLNPMQQISCTTECAFLCRRVGLMRKYSLFLFLGVLLALESNSSLAYNLIQRCCDAYGVFSPTNARLLPINLASSKSNILDVGCGSQGFASIQSHHSWFIQRKVLYLLSGSIFRETNDVIGTCRSLSNLLRYFSWSEARRDSILRIYASLIDEFNRSEISILKGEQVTPTTTTTPLSNKRISLHDHDEPQYFSSVSLSTLTPVKGGESRYAGLASSDGMESEGGLARSLPSKRILGSSPLTMKSNTAAGAAGVAASTSSSSTSQSVRSFSTYLRPRNSLFSSMNNNITTSNSSTSAYDPTNIDECIQRPLNSVSSSLLLSSFAMSSNFNSGSSSGGSDKNGTSNTMDIASMGNAIKDGLRNIPLPNFSNFLKLEDDNELEMNKNRSLAIKNVGNGNFSSRRNPGENQKVRRSFERSRHYLRKRDNSTSHSIMDNNIMSFVMKDKDIVQSIVALIDRYLITLEDEESTLANLYYLSQQVPPGTSLRFPIQVDRVRVLDPDSPHKLIKFTSISLKNAIKNKLKDNSANKMSNSENHSGLHSSQKSALFFDPFASKKTNLNRHQQEVVWSQDQHGRARITLTNPLSVPIVIDSVTLEILRCQNNVVDGDLNDQNPILISIPTPFEVPSNSVSYEHDIHFSLSDVGKFQLVGIRLFCKNIVYPVVLNSNGYPCNLPRDLDDDGLFFINCRSSKLDNTQLDLNSKDNTRNMHNSEEKNSDVTYFTIINYTPGCVVSSGYDCVDKVTSSISSMIPTAMIHPTSGSPQSDGKLTVYCGEKVAQRIKLVLDQSSLSCYWNSQVMIADVRVFLLVTEFHESKKSYSERKLEIVPFSTILKDYESKYSNHSKDLANMVSCKCIESSDLWMEFELNLSHIDQLLPSRHGWITIQFEMVFNNDPIFQFLSSNNDHDSSSNDSNNNDNNNNNNNNLNHRAWDCTYLRSTSLCLQIDVQPALSIQRKRWDNYHEFVNIGRRLPMLTVLESSMPSIQEELKQAVCDSVRMIPGSKGHSMDGTCTIAPVSTHRCFLFEIHNFSVTPLVFFINDLSFPVILEDLRIELLHPQLPLAIPSQSSLPLVFVVKSLLDDQQEDAWTPVACSSHEIVEHLNQLLHQQGRWRTVDDCEESTSYRQGTCVKRMDDESISSKLNSSLFPTFLSFHLTFPWNINVYKYQKISFSRSIQINLSGVRKALQGSSSFLISSMIVLRQCQGEDSNEEFDWKKYAFVSGSLCSSVEIGENDLLITTNPMISKEWKCSLTFKNCGKFLVYHLIRIYVPNQAKLTSSSFIDDQKHRNHVLTKDGWKCHSNNVIGSNNGDQRLDEETGAQNEMWWMRDEPPLEVIVR